MSNHTCDKCGYVGKSIDTMCARCGTPYPVPDTTGEPAPVRKGQVIANRYVVLDMIGRGGMGCIYKVQDNTLGEIVALKTLLPEYAREKMVVERFFNEARIARGLSHPHIVRVHDIGVAEDVMYISMELLQGRTLRSMLDKVEPGRRIPLNAILRMFDALCAALEYAHHVTIHRDIKPENVMVLPDGTVKLMDFGISKLKSNPSLTSASMVMGTPHYMSPEQLKNSANVDGRADIYSVGIMLYEALTGDIPTAVTHNKDTIQEVPRALDPVISKCCHPQPDKRFQSVSELRVKLREVRVDIETQSGKVGSPDSAPLASVPKGSNWPRQLIACIGIGLVGVGAYFSISNAENRRKELIVNAPTIVVSEMPESVSETTSGDRPETFAALKSLIERARPVAGTALHNAKDTSYYPQAKTLMDDADELWGTAMESGVDDADGLTMGWPILQRYLAIIHWPENMMFVSHHNRASYFIDIREVSALEFQRFCDAENWRIPPGLIANYDSAVNVTYYDALAYLARAPISKSLPTQEQWDAATKVVSSPSEEEGGDSLVRLTGQVYEWIYSEKTAGAVAEELFGESMPYIVWRYDNTEITVTGTKTMLYEAFDKNIGFRGVIQLPETFEDAQVWINSK